MLSMETKIKAKQANPARLINFILKNQAIGLSTIVVCIAINTIYSSASFFLEPISAASIRLWIIAIPVFAAFVALPGIVAWTGLAMATTPNPKTIEELN